MEDNLYRYLQWSPDYFWGWEESAGIISRRVDGETIAYTDFLVQVLEHLSLQGWPPFGALLLVLSATNGSNTIDIQLQQMNDVVKEYQVNTGLVPQVGLLTEATLLLDVLESLPVVYRTGAGRLRLLQALFQNCHNRVAATRSQLWQSQLLQYKSHATHLMAVPAIHRQGKLLLRNYERDFKCLALLARRFPDAESIISAIAALPELDIPELLIEEEEVSTDLVEQLTANPKTFEVGALLKHLWSGLHIPLHHTLPGDQPLGGVADLTNKGSFDRLLLSEFANDDLVLLSRLANNEALFLHREVPPASDDFERIILVDISLKNWGTPKLLAYALALAICKHPKTDIHCKVFAVGKHCVPVNYSNVDAIIESLRHTDTGLHAAAGLQHFFETYDSHKEIEVFFISGEEAGKHAAVQKITHDYYHFFKYWLTVTAEGAIALYKRIHNSKKLVQQIQLPLQQLWQKKPKLNEAVALVEPVPVVKHRILYPASNNIRRVLGTGNGAIFILTGNRLLFRTYHGMEKKGWEYLPLNIPATSNLFELGVNGNGEYLLLCFDAAAKEVLLLNIDNEKQETLLFPDWSNSDYPEFFFYAGAFYYMNNQYCWAIELNVKAAITRYPVVGNRLKRAYKNRQEELQGLKANFDRASVKPCFKKLDRVFINTEGNLVFNDSHVLIINSRGIIKLLFVSEDRRKVDIQAAKPQKQGDGFVFEDGSTVSMDGGGMIKLEAAKPYREVVYDVVAAEQEIPNKILFLKNAFHKEGRVDEEIKAALYKVGEQPAVLSSFVIETAARVYAEKLTAKGIQVSIEKVQNSRVVFVPAMLDAALAIGTPHYFAGDTSFYPFVTESLVVRDSHDLYKRSVSNFINNIKAYATGH